MAIVGIPDDLGGELRSKSDEQLALAKANLSQMAWEASLGGIVTQTDAYQANAILAAVDAEIIRRKAAA
jgi:hypothetical protein